MEIKKLAHKGDIEKYATWFSAKWGIPLEAYVESMNESLIKKSAVPSWFLMFDEDITVGGIGIIANDFHERTDLTPNICALYVEQPYRNKGIAGKLLEVACDECLKFGITNVYLITDHTSFYERYGWKFFTMVKNSYEDSYGRLYVKKLDNQQNYKEKVYQYLKMIPQGRVSTYGDIAEYLGNKKLARVVGNVLHNNPDPIGQPCFKIVNRQGKLAAHFGDGIELQRERLKNDGVEVIDDQVDLKRYHWSIKNER